MVIGLSAVQSGSNRASDLKLRARFTPELYDKILLPINCVNNKMRETEK